MMTDWYWIGETIEGSVMFKSKKLITKKFTLELVGSLSYFDEKMKYK